MATNVKRLAVLGLLVFVFGIGSAHATTITRSPNPADLWDLDHNYAYTWRIDDVTLGANVITSASLKIANISNWDNQANILYISLFDTATNAGVASFTDNSTPGNYFASTHTSAIPAGTQWVQLASPSFTMTPTNYVYNFSASDLQKLTTYLQNDGKFALTFDPDCHYYNDGITLTINTQPVPEPASMTLLGMGLVGVGSALRRRRNRK